MRPKGIGLFLIGCGLTTLLSGCFMLEIGAAMSTGCPNDKTARKTKTVVECDERPETGSNIGRLRCYRKVQREDEREADREEMRRLQIKGGTTTEPTFRPQPQPRVPGGRRSRISRI
jgi:hypothetical protein